MSRFEFRLESVLRYRLRQERLAELRQRVAAQAVQAADARVARTTAELGRAALALQSSLEVGITPTTWFAYHDRTTALAHELTAAEAEARNAREHYAKVSAEHRQVAIAVEVLKTLKQQRLDAHQQVESAAEQRRLEEIVLRQWTTTPGLGDPDTAQKETP